MNKGEWGYLGLATPYETIYTNGKKIRVYPNGDKISTSGDQNKKTPEKPINKTKEIIIPLFLFAIAVPIATKIIDKVTEKWKP
jgi:hypothetical protein